MRRTPFILLFSLLVISVFANVIWFGYSLQEDVRIKQQNDSLTIVKLKLEIELKKLQLQELSDTTNTSN